MITDRIFQCEQRFYLVVIEGKELFMRERAAGDYHISAYFLATISTELPGYILFSNELFCGT
jgi:hypothetical protein